MPNSRDHCEVCSYETEGVLPVDDKFAASFEHSVAMDRVFGRPHQIFEQTVIDKQRVEPRRLKAAIACADTIKADACLIFDKEGNLR